MDALLFVDTNIFLDFYRARTSDISTKFLQQIERCKDRLILSSQLEMEYKKNRQFVVLQALEKGAPDWSRLSPPALISDLQASKMIEKHKSEIQSQQKKVVEKTQKILKNPAANDEVYKVLQRIFKHASPYNLNRDSKQRFKIRSLARKRFFLGYPPRKNDDTSYGDSINWEWIVQCAIDSGKDIVIVTRDSDYGVIYSKESFLNDWLQQEFKERVSRKRKILLTSKLSEGLKIIHANITKDMIDEEAQILSELQEEMPHSL